MSKTPKELAPDADATPGGWPGAVRAAGDGPGKPVAELMSGAVWDEFLDQLRLAGEYIMDERAPETPLDRAEGYRHLGVLLKIGLEEMLVDWDPDRPRFHWSDGTVKWGLDCSDALYALAAVRPGAVYRVRGRRASVHFLGFQLVGPLSALSDRDADALEIAPDGSFELVIGGEPRKGNWMPLDEGATTLTVRQFFYDWENEHPAPLWIERIDTAESREPAIVSPTGIAAQLPALGTFVREGTEFWAESSILKRDENLNRFPSDHGIGSAALASQKYQSFGIGYFSLQDDEALIVSVTPPRAKYWSLHLGSFWGESVDYINYASSLNGHQAVLDSDGVFHAVISRRDPGVANWLDTAGRAEGIMIYRWNQADGSPIPSTRLVRLEDLDKTLPAGMPHVDPEQRRATIEMRRAHMRRRIDRPL